MWHTGPATVAGRASVFALVVLLAVGSGALWWPSETGPQDRLPASVSAGATGDVSQDTRAAALVAALEAAWDDRARQAFVAAAGSSTHHRMQSRDWAATVFRNLRVLHVRDMSLRYVGHSTSGVRSSPAAADAFLAEVAVTWTPSRRSGFAPHPTSEVTVPLTVADNGQSLAVTGTATGAAALPVWLAGPLHLRRVGGALCVGVGDRNHLALVSRLARRAVDDVAAVVRTSPRVVVVHPQDARTAAQVLGSDRTDVARIAAVTTTVDGSDGEGSPVQVVLNPPAFDALGQRGAQVVMTHEVAHAVTGATTARMPLWVAEGFADLVALRGSDVPLQVAAGHFLARVLHRGPPRALPHAADFASSAHGLGRTYEAAWLVFRMLTERYGDPATVGFYEQVRDGMPVPRALHQQFGLDPAALLASWRHYLDRLVDL